jgi:hypothetical protein
VLAVPDIKILSAGSAGYQNTQCWQRWISKYSVLAVLDIKILSAGSAGYQNESRL